MLMMQMHLITSMGCYNATKVDDATTVPCLMLTCMDPKLQKHFENATIFDMIEVLNAMYQT
jgi:hypothetical protein